MSINNVETDTRWTPPTDRGEVVVKNTHDAQRSTDTLPVQPLEQSATGTDTYIEEPLTAEDIAFTRMVARGIPVTSAFRQTHPHFKDKSYPYTRKKALQVFDRANVQQEIATAKDTMVRLARLSEDRIEEVLTDGDIHAKGTRVPDVAMFVYDHANGKAKQSTEIISRSVSVNIDLTSSVTEQE